MVDINLFKEEEEEKRERAPTSKKGREFEDDLGEDLELEKELSGSSLSDEELLSDEALPDFEEPEEKEEEDYEFGEAKEKKSSLFVWILLVIVVVSAALYLFVLQPKQIKPKQMTTPFPHEPPVDEKLAQEQKQRTGEAVEKIGTITAPQDSSPSSRVAAMMDKEPFKILGSIETSVEASKIVLQDLTSRGQFGAVLISGNRFIVEYVSETPNVARPMGYKIQTLLGASSHKVSPEDRHRTSGRIYYYGVVSGDLPQKPSKGTVTPARQFATVDSFIEGVKSLTKQNRLITQEVQKLSESSGKGVRQVSVRMKIEGGKAQAVAFLDSLIGFQGNCSIAKLLLVPLDYSDFEASQVKLVLDFYVTLG